MWTFYNDIPRPTWGLRINSAKPLLDLLPIRQGIQHALNWDLVLKEIFYGDYTRMNTVADGYGPTGNPHITARPYSISTAQSLFATAGFTTRGPDGILINNQNQRLSFTITTGYKQIADVLTILKDQAKPAGLELNIEILEQTAAWAKADQKTHDIILSALNVSPELYPRFWETYHSDNAFEKTAAGTIDRTRLKTNTNNETSTANPQIDLLIDQYRQTPDLPTITALSQQIIALLHQDAAFVPGWKAPFWRIAAWRWLRFPADGNVKQSRTPDDYHLHWIDPTLKTQTQQAIKSGTTFPIERPIWDQYKTN